MKAPFNIFIALLLTATTLIGCDPAGLDSAAVDRDGVLVEAGAPYAGARTAGAARTHYGPAQPLGTGTARSFVTFDAAGAPTALGVLISEKGLVGLPEHGDHESNMTVLPLPVQTTGLTFDHISLDWNPHGHEPDGLFTIPHFDFHFYMETEAERMTWTPADPLWEQKVARAPEARYIPAGYIQLPGGIPQMGAHWIDVTDPTYGPGGAFTEVFIWGSYDGRVIFAEPMITKAFLESRPDFEEALAQPEAFQRAGYYPTHYSIRYNASRKAYVVTLEGLTYRNAG